MRRSICQIDPTYAFAGQTTTWKFSYTTASPLPKGTRIKFDPLLRGRPIDWQLPQVNPKVRKNLIWISLPDGKTIFPLEKIGINLLAPTFEFSIPSDIKVGETISIYLGSPEKRETAISDQGNRAQTVIQRRRPFHLYIDVKGKGDYKEPEIFMIDVRGNALYNIRIIAPSLVAKNKRFDVLIRFEDAFGNLTNQAPENTLIELSHEHLRENLSWKLFVPETGFIVLPNLYFNEPGVYRIQLWNKTTNEKFFSTPIKCFAELEVSQYWGLLHGESTRVDASENIDSCLRHLRDEKSLQFFATSSFENIEETSNDSWKLISQHVTEYNEENRFTTFLGFQWVGESGNEGVRQILYWKDSKPLLRKKDLKNSHLKKIYKSHSPKELFSIPCFTMAKGFETNFEDMSPEFERVVEIYNSWGSSECNEKEGNLRPIKSFSKGVGSTDVGSIRRALNKNIRLGFVAGGLDDRGIYQSLYNSEQAQYSPGLTAILAPEQTREALLQALYQRSCYATTGERMIIGFHIAGMRMGSELNTKTKPGLNLNRHIVGFACGTAPIEEILLIRGGQIFHRFYPKALNFDFTLDDGEILSKIALNSSDDKPPFTYYYMRVLQQDGHLAWSSPIWVDYFENKSISIPKKKIK
ncbi:MAG: DUF3604 domain-containing protein [Chlamydiae bacterium]|nr:DUF3604 domain-containing protein [Chlamydiota bacterium]